MARDYARRGLPRVASRWRGTRGEVDLIARDGDGLVFIEVKKSRSFARAVERITRQQLARIHAAAEEYLARMPAGLLTPVRIDVALVDGQGAIRIIENAYGH